MSKEHSPATKETAELQALLEQTNSDAIILSAKLNTNEDLGRPTVCRDWDIRALVIHFLGNSRMFSRAAAGLALQEPKDDLLGQDPARGVKETLDQARELWRRPEAWAGICEFPDLGVVPKTLVANIALTDLAVHCWDLRVALGRKAPIEAPVAAAALAFMTEMLDDDLRAPLGFDPPLDIDIGAPASDRLLGFLGRRP